MSRYLSIAKIYSKMKTKDDIMNYFREQDKSINKFNNIGLYYPKLSSYDNRFFL